MRCGRSGCRYPDGHGGPHEGELRDIAGGPAPVVDPHPRSIDFAELVGVFVAGLVVGLLLGMVL